MNEEEFKSLLVSILEKKIDSKEETSEVATIIMSYLESMNSGQIEKADKLLQKNLSLLEKLI
jgi:hypothetical protein